MLAMHLSGCGRARNGAEGTRTPQLGPPPPAPPAPGGGPPGGGGDAAEEVGLRADPVPAG